MGRTAGGERTLCSSGSRVTSLLGFAGDKLCRFPELSSRSLTQPSSSTGTLTPVLITTSSPGEAKHRLL